MVALDLNPPVKHAGLVSVRLGKLINKTLTTDNWHREHSRSTEAKQKERAATTPFPKTPFPFPFKRLPRRLVRLGKLNKTMINR